jgi:hypothetical protein
MLKQLVYKNPCSFIYIAGIVLLSSQVASFVIIGIGLIVLAAIQAFARIR